MTLADLLDWTASTDRIYHFTSSPVAMEKILLNRTLRFNSLRRTNDPREFEYWMPLVGAHGDYDKKEYDRLCEIAPQLVANVKKACKIACFSVDTDSSASDYRDIFDKGYCLPRMWSQYADSHFGVCLVFSRQKLLMHISSDVEAFYLPPGNSFSIFREKVSYGNNTSELSDALNLSLPQDHGKTGEQLMEERIDKLLFSKY